ncbi:hypothetical protein DP42_5710 [Burkholderia pseudomallei]|nr:hypothetical protein DP42_5710 [Burkholderia pseudomallei]
MRWSTSCASLRRGASSGGAGSADSPRSNGATAAPPNAGRPDADAGFIRRAKKDPARAGSKRAMQTAKAAPAMALQPADSRRRDITPRGRCAGAAPTFDRRDARFVQIMRSNAPSFITKR